MARGEETTPALKAIREVRKHSRSHQFRRRCHLGQKVFPGEGSGVAARAAEWSRRVRTGVSLDGNQAWTRELAWAEGQEFSGT